jgi:hypothetical protein
MSTHITHSTNQRCEEEMRNTSPCTRNLFLASLSLGPATLCGRCARARGEEDIPQTRTCTVDLFLLGAAAARPIGR